jgi:hypothetical protein
MRLRNIPMLGLFITIGSAQTGGLNLAEAHKQLEWTRTRCVVDTAKTPCRTVRYREYSIGIGSGFDSASIIEAFDRHGSEAKVITAVRRRFWLFPAWTARTTELVLREQNRTVITDHDRKFSTETHGTAVRGSPYGSKTTLQSMEGPSIPTNSDRLPRICSRYRRVIDRCRGRI